MLGDFFDGIFIMITGRKYIFLKERGIPMFKVWGTA